MRRNGRTRGARKLQCLSLPGHHTLASPFTTCLVMCSGATRQTLCPLSLDRLSLYHSLSLSLFHLIIFVTLSLSLESLCNSLSLFLSFEYLFYSLSLLSCSFPIPPLLFVFTASLHLSSSSILFYVSLPLFSDLFTHSLSLALPRFCLSLS